MSQETTPNPGTRNNPREAEGEHELLIPIRRTRMGASTRIKALSPTVKVEERWGNTHGEARVWGTGLIFMRDISNSGIHRCQIIEIKDGKIIRIVEQNEGSRFCSLCERYW